MKIVFTKHALKRMKERAIKEEWVRETIEIPDYTVSREGTVESNKKIENNTLKVIYNKKHNFIKIISVMWR